MSIEDDIENEPEFICSQLRAGQTLTEADVAAIQAVLSEIEKLDNDAVDVFHDGRIAGFREIGGQELVDAVERKDKAVTERAVRKAMARLLERTAEINREVQ